MDTYKISVWFEDDENWMVEQSGDPRVYVYKTKRSALRKVEMLLDDRAAVKEA